MGFFLLAILPAKTFRVYRSWDLELGFWDFACPASTHTFSSRSASPESLREPKRASVNPRSEKSEVKLDQETPREARRGFKKTRITTVPILPIASASFALGSDSFRWLPPDPACNGTYRRLSEAIRAETTFFQSTALHLIIAPAFSLQPARYGRLR